MQVGNTGKFTWHINQSTRPVVQDKLVEITEDQPVRTQSYQGGPTTIGQHVDHPFTITETGIDVLQVDLDWPSPDDLDLEVYKKNADGSLTEVGSSGNFVGEKEHVTLEVPDPGRYILRVINIASASPTATVTASVFARGKDTIIPATAKSEAWTLTCELPGGRRFSQAVVVNRGGVIDVGNACR